MSATKQRSFSKSTKHAPVEDESIYNMTVVQNDFSAPKVRNHNSAGSVSSAMMPPKPKMHADSSQIENILNPIKGLRDAQARAGVKPVDHSRNHRSAIKEASQLNGLRKLSDQDAANSPGIKRTSSASSKVHNVGSFGARSTSAPHRRLSRDTSQNHRDFLAENKQQALAANLPGAAPRPPKRSEKADDAQSFLDKKDYGRVPRYLEQRKVEMADQEEAQRAAKEAAKIPAGMRIMPEEERQEMLALLKKNLEEVDKAIQRLPFVIETPSQKRRQSELDARLKEIVEAQKIFSRPNVLIRITDE